MEEKIYSVYEQIRDNDEITECLSNTKKLILNLLENDNSTIKYCIRKSQEEKQEVEDAKIGNHFHKGMTKREILVNEISQYMYWLIIMDISKHIKYQYTKVFEKIREIINSIDILNIGETEKITIEEIINHDLENMSKKEYLKDSLN